MPRSRESVIAELKAKKIKYVDEMSYSELVELLAEAEIEKADVKIEKAEVKKKALEVPIVKVGVTTINDHERRITMLERKLMNG